MSAYFPHRAPDSESEMLVAMWRQIATNPIRTFDDLRDLGGLVRAWLEYERHVSGCAVAMLQKAAAREAREEAAEICDIIGEKSGLHVVAILTAMLCAASIRAVDEMPME